MEQEALLAEKGRRHLADFIRAGWHVVEPRAPLIWGRHNDAICDHLEAVTRSQIKNLIITIPPGCTKTLAACVFWPMWSWLHDPALRWLIGGNEEGLATDSSMKSRNLIQSEWFQRHFGGLFELLPDQNQKTWFDNNKTGRRQCTSVGASVTGKKSDILVLDDPNDAHRIQSAADRKAVIGWVKDAWFDRVNDATKARRVVIAQRTGVEDAIGYLKGIGGWEELCIPEEFEPRRKYITSIGWTDWRTQPGELLRPERFGPAEIAEAKNRLGTFGYRAKHQQDPESPEGYRFRKTWFRYWRWDGDFIVLEDERRGLYRFHPRDCQRFGTVDDAASAKTSADYTVIASWLVSPRNDLVWLNCRRDRWEIPDQPKIVLGEYAANRLNFIAIERVGAKNALLKFCEREKMAVRPLDPMGADKLTRATPALVLCETGRVWFPAPDAVPGFPIEDVKAEMLAFTGIDKADKHDDIVDCLAYAALIVTTPGSTSKAGSPGATAAPNPYSGRTIPVTGRIIRR